MCLTFESSTAINCTVASVGSTTGIDRYSTVYRQTYFPNVSTRSIRTYVSKHYLFPRVLTQSSLLWISLQQVANHAISFRSRGLSSRELSMSGRPCSTPSTCVNTTIEESLKDRRLYGRWPILWSPLASLWIFLSIEYSHYLYGDVQYDTRVNPHLWDIHNTSPTAKCTNILEQSLQFIAVENI